VCGTVGGLVGAYMGDTWGDYNFNSTGDSPFRYGA
jgi:hypothetical protein